MPTWFFHVTYKGKAGTRLNEETKEFYPFRRIFQRKYISMRNAAVSKIREKELETHYHFIYLFIYFCLQLHKHPQKNSANPE